MSTYGDITIVVNVEIVGVIMIVVIIIRYGPKIDAAHIIVDDAHNCGGRAALIMLPVSLLLCVLTVGAHNRAWGDTAHRAACH